MGISFNITSVREGTIFNVMQFLALEKVTGSLSIRFGKIVPEASIYFVDGNLTTAEFGSITQDNVIDILLCQEFAITEVSFNPGKLPRINEAARVKKASSLSGIVLNASKDVDMCEARSLIYGMLPMKGRNAKESDSLLRVLHDFESWESELSTLPASSKDKQAPLTQCVLLTRALRQGVISYQAPLVSLKTVRPLINMLEPLNEKEENNLRGYLRSLLPHQRATHLPIERFYAFATAIESIAQRRGTTTGDKARQAIQDLVEEATRPLNAAKI